MAEIGRVLALLFVGVVLGMLTTAAFKALTRAIRHELRRFRLWRGMRRLDDLAALTWPKREYEHIEEDW
jgi:hypothetical protein